MTLKAVRGPLSLLVTAIGAVLAAGAAIAASGQYTGVASCAGSTCHGRAEGNGAFLRIAAHAYYTWARDPTAFPS